MILIADDDPSTRALIRLYLKGNDEALIEAANGKEALDVLSDRIDVVLLDLHMPEVTGMECLRYIQKHHGDISTIIVTASNDIKNAIEAMKIGAFDYVVKPLERDALKAIVRQAVKMARQAKHIKKVEAELAQAREQEISIASKIQQFLLKGQPPLNLNGINIAQVAVASRAVDGDFFDILNCGDHSFDLIIGDVMGKGIPAALLGAAIKSHLMRVNAELMQSSSSGTIPDPREIVTRLHATMIDKLEELETFVTLWYCRFDLEKYQLSFVDCGHMRIIHFQNELKKSTLLKGENMPLGFPEKKPFHQIVVPFKTRDLFFFYSDGLTEAKNSEGDFFGESRLVELIRKNFRKDVESLVYTVWKDVISFTQSEKLDDDFTSVAIEINENVLPETLIRDPAEEKITQDIRKFNDIRRFIQNFCINTPDFKANDLNFDKMQRAMQNIVANIIKHAYTNHACKPVEILARLNGNDIALHVSGIEDQPNENVQDDTQNKYVITDCIDASEYQSNENGSGHAILKITL